MEKLSRPGQRMFVTASHIEMLDQIGGGEGVKLSAKEWLIRRRLNWHTKARSAVRHMLNGEQRLTAQDERDIEAAFMRHCAEKIEANHDENRKLFATIRSSLELLERSDPDFHKPAIEALGELADRLRGVAGKSGSED